MAVYLPPSSAKEAGSTHGAQGQSSRSPLTFTALKSHMGHAEPAAGILGLARLADQLHGGHTTHQAHLNHLNPYLAASLEPHPDATLLPRGPAPWALAKAGASAGLVGGVSAFAFQGGCWNGFSCRGLMCCTFHEATRRTPWFYAHTPTPSYAPPTLPHRHQRARCASGTSPQHGPYHPSSTLSPGPSPPLACRACVGAPACAPLPQTHAREPSFFRGSRQPDHGVQA